MVILEQVVEFLRKILKKNDVIIVGVSGGSDSMCLLQLLINLKEELNLKIVCAHVNHGVRPESEEEKEFVLDFCLENKCVFEYKVLSFKDKKNFEMQAREKRYEFYEELVKKYKANYLMTAHHGDDLVETVLMRLARGASFLGYAGFGKITDKSTYKLVRPLVYVTKEEIEQYNKKNKIKYYVDKSNELDKYTRNRFRKYMLPFLKEENGLVHKKFLKFSEELLKIDEYLEKELNTVLTRVYGFGKVDLHEFKKLDLVLQKRVLEYILKEEYQHNIKVINDKHLELMGKLCLSKKSNLEIDLPLNKRYVKSYGYAFFKKDEEVCFKEYILEDEIILNEREKIVRIDKTDIIKSNYLLRLDSREIKLPLKLRTRRYEDKMAVKNLEGSKKIKDIFIDAKIPRDKRDLWPVVVDSDDVIIWLPGLKKSKFDKNNDEFYDIIYKYVVSEEIRK